MTRWSRTAIGLACMAGMALLVCTATVAYSQDPSDLSKQPDKKKPETRRMDVQVKVSSKDGKQLPSHSVVEISGQEPACGSLSSKDVTAIIDDKGEVIFQNLPACKVTIKVNLIQYPLKRQAVDLADPKDCPALAPTPAKGNGKAAPGPPACTVSLLLEPHLP